MTATFQYREVFGPSIPVAKIKAVIGDCLICGEAATGKHYGIVACLGCKTFFRRAVVQRQDTICKRDTPCNVLVSARKSCRACRYKKCLECGMSKEALQPRRDLIGCRRTKPRSSISMGQSPSTSNDEMNKTQLVTLIERLTESDERIRKRKFELVRSQQEAVELSKKTRGPNGSKSIDRSSRSPEWLYTALQSPESCLGFPALSQTLSEQFKIHRKLMVMLGSDIALVTQADLLMMIEWVRAIPVFQNMPTADKTSLIKRFAVSNLVIENGYYTASVNLDDVWLISNGTCMPRNFEALPEESKNSLTADRRWRQEKLYKQMTDICIDEVATPFRKLKLSATEVLALKIIILFNCSCSAEYCDISEPSRKTVQAFRNRVMAALFAYYEHLGIDDCAERFGSVILLVSGIASAAQVMLESYQIMRLFKITPFDNLANELLFNI